MSDKIRRIAQYERLKQTNPDTDTLDARTTVYADPKGIHAYEKRKYTTEYYQQKPYGGLRYMPRGKKLKTYTVHPEEMLVGIYHKPKSLRKRKSNSISSQIERGFEDFGESLGKPFTNERVQNIAGEFGDVAYNYMLPAVYEVGKGAAIGVIGGGAALVGGPVAGIAAGMAADYLLTQYVDPMAPKQKSKELGYASQAVGIAAGMYTGYRVANPTTLRSTSIATQAEVSSGHPVPISRGLNRTPSLQYLEESDDVVVQLNTRNPLVPRVSTANEPITEERLVAEFGDQMLSENVDTMDEFLDVNQFYSSLI